MRLASFRRRGFTLIELMVVIAIIAFLAGLTMLVVPTIMEKDRTVDAVTSIEGWLQNARLRALRDKQPRGVRFIINTGLPPHVSTEAAYIELPPVIVLGDGPGSYPLNSPRVIFTYDVNTPVPQYPQGSIANRRCQLQNLTPFQVQQVQPGSTLHMPVLNATQFYLITNVFPAGGGNAPGTFNVIVELADYPDAQMGAGTSLATYHFGISSVPRPLLGEPVMQLPVNTCVDLTPNVSQPGFTGVPGQMDYDVMFAPSGQTLSVATAQSTGAAGQIFLWVRDYTKVPEMEPLTLGWATYPNGPASAAYMNALRRGGEQMIVVVKSKSGGIGAAPVFWPDGTINDPFYNARKAASVP